MPFIFQFPATNLRLFMFGPSALRLLAAAPPRP